MKLIYTALILLIFTPTLLFGHVDSTHGGHDDPHSLTDVEHDSVHAHQLEANQSHAKDTTKDLYEIKGTETRHRHSIGNTRAIVHRHSRLDSAYNRPESVTHTNRRSHQLGLYDIAFGERHEVNYVWHNHDSLQDQDHDDVSVAGHQHHHFDNPDLLYEFHVHTKGDPHNHSSFSTIETKYLHAHTMNGHRKTHSHGKSVHSMPRNSSPYDGHSPVITFPPAEIVVNPVVVDPPMTSDPPLIVNPVMTDDPDVPVVPDLPVIVNPPVMPNNPVVIPVVTNPIVPNPPIVSDADPIPVNTVGVGDVGGTDQETIVVYPVGTDVTQVSIEPQESTPVSVRVEPEKVLRITYLAFEDGILTLQITAFSVNVNTNHLYIRIGDTTFVTPSLFFGGYYLQENEMREVSLKPHENGRSVIIGRAAYTQLIRDKTYTFPLKETGYLHGWQPLTDFDIKDFTVALRRIGHQEDWDVVTQDDIDADGNRTGSITSAPSLPSLKKFMMWGALKVSD